jgi:superfamily I DNA/RNA helicase
VGLLYTQRTGSVNRLRAALDGYGVPYYWMNEDSAAKRTLPDTDTVWLLTVHAAKGMEFPIVFLFATEALRVDGEDPAVAGRFARVGYVGMTRARDLLTVTYTRPNGIIEKLRTSNDVEQWTWPDDYELD